MKVTLRYLQQNSRHSDARKLLETLNLPLSSDSLAVSFLQAIRPSVKDIWLLFPSTFQNSGNLFFEESFKIATAANDRAGIQQLMQALHVRGQPLSKSMVHSLADWGISNR